MSPTDFGSAKLTSMHDESFFAKLAVFDGQPRFTVVLPHDQRQLIIEVFDGIRNLRMMLENHPKVRAADIEVSKWLREGLVWHY